MELYSFFASSLAAKMNKDETASHDPTWRHPLPATPVLESLGVTSHDFQNIFIVITLVLFISFTKDKLVNTDFEVLSIIGRSNSHHTMTGLRGRAEL